MQIKSGYLKNKNVSVPESAKPVKSVVLNSIFSTIDYLVKNASCLDLFAGSGILGFEALSRGAKNCTFVESSYSSCKQLEDSIDKLNLKNRAEVINCDALKFIGNSNVNFDIVLLDPPYTDPTKHLFKTLNYIVDTESLIIYLKSKDKEFEFANDFTVLKTKTFGKTEVMYLKLKP